MSARVVARVAEAAGVEPTDLDPLYDQVDPDALNELFEPTGDGTVRGPGTVILELAGHRVFAYSDGTVIVQSLAEE